MTTRRDFVQGLALALGGMPAATGAVRADAALRGRPARPGPGQAPAERTGSDVGSLFPFIRSQAVHGEFPLSFLRDEFRDLPAWKRAGAGQAPGAAPLRPAAPATRRPEVVAKVDRGDYVRETVTFNTTPDIRVPAYVLVPKGSDEARPGDRGAARPRRVSTSGAGRRSSRSTDEHSVLADFKRGLYAGKSIASELARRGYVVVVIDMFYWGERRHAAGRRPGRLARTAGDDPAASASPRSTAAPAESEQLVGRTIYSAGFTWSGRDVLGTTSARWTISSPGPRSTRAGSVASGCRSAASAPATSRRSTTGSRRRSSSAGWRRSPRS